MGFFSSKKTTDDVVVTDYVNSDSSAVLEQTGPAAKFLVLALDKAAGIQSNTIVKYVQWLSRRNSSASPAQIQQLLDKHFLRTVTGSGAAAGITAALPGVGFVAGAAAVGAESLLFLDAAVIYALSSAHLRGIDVSNPERRKAIVLLAVLGAEGTALADASITNPTKILAKSSTSRLTEFNTYLFKVAAKRISKSIRMAWLGKLMPLGLGAVLGSVANRKIGKNLVDHISDGLGALPE